MYTKNCKMASKNDPLLQQADSLWKMLDDLAETDPEGYKKLIDNVIKEQKEHWKPPEPVFCFRTVKLPESINHHVFVNICKWEQVMKPKDGDTKISLLASNFRDLSGYSSKHSVMDICFHNDIIDQTGKDSQCWKFVASLALDYIEKQVGIRLSKSYKVLSIKYKGDIGELKRFLFSPTFENGSSAKPAYPASSQTDTGSLLDGLSNIVQREKEPKPGAIPKDFKGMPSETLVPGKRDEKIPKKPLIQEISTTKQTKVTPKNNIPKHNIEISQATSDKPKCIMVKVKLPEIQSGAECDLNISKQDLVLCSAKYSKLHLQLPEEGNEDAATSTFNKTTHELMIIIPTAKT